MSDQAQCSCLRVVYSPVHHENGTLSEMWVCERCGHEFVPMAHVDAQEKLRGALRAAEWGGRWGRENRCPVCGWHRFDNGGHAEHCAVRAALSPSPEPTPRDEYLKALKETAGHAERFPAAPRESPPVEHAEACLLSQDCDPDGWADGYCPCVCTCEAEGPAAPREPEPAPKLRPSTRLTPWAKDCACSDFGRCVYHQAHPSETPERPSDAVLNERSRAEPAPRETERLCQCGHPPASHPQTGNCVCGCPKFARDPLNERLMGRCECGHPGWRHAGGIGGCLDVFRTPAFGPPCKCLLFTARRRALEDSHG